MLQSLKELGWQVEGVDFDPAAVQRARTKGLNVHLGTLEDQRFADNTFDAITMSHVIEHVHRPIALFQECHRLLRPGGRLVVVTPNASSWGHRRYGAGWRGLEPPRHLHIFTLSSLAAICARAGFIGGECRSVVRGGGILLASRQLRHTGNQNAALQPSAVLRLWAEVMGLAEWARTLTDEEAGEELVSVIAK
jgi:SAM-dependent methyltransferase